MGLTLGRGYDLRDKSASLISAQLVKAGINLIEANLLASASRLKGRAAELFIIKNDLLDYEISPNVQLSLFNIAYAEKEKVVLQQILSLHMELLIGVNYQVLYWNFLLI